MAPIGFAVLASEVNRSAVATVASIGLLGTAVLAVGFPTSVFVRGVRSGLPVWQWSLFVVAAVASHAIVALIVAVSYSL
jgi:hypothetical protein